jgi:hypothetical protein
MQVVRHDDRRETPLQAGGARAGFQILGQDADAVRGQGDEGGRVAVDGEDIVPEAPEQEAVTPRAGRKIEDRTRWRDQMGEADDPGRWAHDRLQWVGWWRCRHLEPSWRLHSAASGPTLAPP